MPVREGKWVTPGIRRVSALLWAPLFLDEISVFLRCTLANKTVVTKAPHATEGRAELPAVWIFAPRRKEEISETKLFGIPWAPRLAGHELQLLTPETLSGRFRERC